MSNPFNATGDATVANPGATDPTRPPSATDTVANNPRHGDSVGLDTPDGAATDDKTTPTVVAIPTIGAATDDTAATRSEDRATEQIIDAVTHDRQCTLTIGEAQDMFRKLLRRPLSERSLQRYCSAGAILSQLISHSQGKEWLLNETSLIRFIERYPITLTEAPTAITAHAPAAITSTVGDATVANPPPTAPPQTTNSPTETPKTDVVAPQVPDTDDTVAKSTPDGAATDDKQPVTVAPPPDTDDFADINHAGERRRLGDVLIENARLSALIEGKEEVITTLKSHDDHMREELKDSKSLINKLSGDVARIATQMLSAMQAIGTAGKSYSLPSDADEVTMTRRTVPPKSPEDH